MRLELFDVSRRWPRQRTQSNDGTSFREQRNFFHSSVQFVGLILPSNSHVEIWTRLQTPAISSDIWHHFVAARWGLHLVPYCQPSSPVRFLSITGHWDVSLPLSLEWHVWSPSSRNNCHAVHRSLSSSASLCDGTVRIFLPCLILSAKLYFTVRA